MITRNIKINDVTVYFETDKVMIHDGDTITFDTAEFEQMIEHYNTYKKMKEIDCEI